MDDIVISVMILLDHICRHTPELMVKMIYLGYLDHEMRLNESPKSLWLTEE